MPKAREIYSPEFKLEALRLIKTNDKSCAQVARDLGIPTHSVVRWHQQQKKPEQAGHPVPLGRGKAALSEQEAQL